MGPFVMIMVTIILFVILRQFLSTVVASIIVVVFFISWFKFNKYHSTVGLFKSNFSAYFKARNKGMNEDEALTVMYNTRFPINKKYPHEIKQMCEEGVRNKNFAGQDNKARYLVWYIFCHENRVPPLPELELKYRQQLEKVYINIKRSYKL